jgi:N-carbamoylputrescine amidase
MASPVRVTVCQTGDSRADFERDWAGLTAHVAERRGALVVLPEMPFAPWFPRTRGFDRATWAAAMAAHDEWVERLGELAPASVVGSRPMERDGRRINEGFLWNARDGYRPVHVKRFLPAEEGFFETDWYRPGDDHFETFRDGALSLAMLICTELWSMGHALRYGKDGAHLLVTPRATGRDTVEKWRTGGRVAAIVSGAYSVSSNRVAPAGGADLGGGGWVVAPDGEVLGVTSAETPFLTVEVDPAHAEASKRTYPRYALE